MRFEHFGAAFLLFAARIAQAAPADAPPDLRHCAPLSFGKPALQGKVALRVLVDRQGRVVQALLDKSSGNRQIDDAAIAAARACVGTPAQKNGQPVAAWATITHSRTVD